MKHTRSLARVTLSGIADSRDLLQCDVDLLTYDFALHLGVLYLPAHHCVDMAGAIELFTRIDPDVSDIQTVAGLNRSTGYRRTNQKWQTT